MRLLQAMAGARHGGAEAFFERLAVALHRAGVAQRIAIRRNAERAGRLRGAGLDVVELPFGGALDLVTPWRLRRTIRAFRPDVVLTWMNRATRACPPGPFVHAARLGGYYNLKYYRRCDHLVGNTRDIVRWLREGGWPAERVHYLPNFVDATPAAPLPREAFATPADAPLLLGLGRLHRNKGFDILLQALARLPGVWLWIAGEGPLRRELEALARRLGVAERVRFLGWREDVPALLAAADVFVCSSRLEPLGNVVIEAWAHDVPVVAAAAEGPTELIREGVNGLLVPKEDAQAMAAAIGRVLEDAGLARGIALGGRAAYEERFTEPAVVRAYIDFLQRIAEPCAASPES